MQLEEEFYGIAGRYNIVDIYAEDVENPGRMTVGYFCLSKSSGISDMLSAIGYKRVRSNVRYPFRGPNSL